MEVFRICQAKYADDLEGKGAKIFGGRWNPPGMAALYTSESRALSLLETLVHAHYAQIRANEYRILTLQIPIISQDIPFIALQDLPLSWRSYLDTSYTQNVGREFLAQEKHLVLAVPSVVISAEFNLIINPEHAGFKEIQVIDNVPLVLDQRLTYSSS